MLIKGKWTPRSRLLRGYLPYTWHTLLSTQGYTCHMPGRGYSQCGTEEERQEVKKQEYARLERLSDLANSIAENYRANETALFGLDPAEFQYVASLAIQRMAQRLPREPK